MLASKSRFAVLPDDDPADAPVPKTKKNKNKTANNATNAKATSNKKKGKANDDDDLKALAFGGKTKKGNNQKKKNNAKNGNSTGSPSKEATPDADWVARDEENVRELYQEDLQKAIMESKLAYMETHNGQDAPTATAKAAPPGMTAMPKGGKKKGQTTVSLDQFQAGMSAALPQPVTVPVKTSGEELRANFFESIKKDATKEMDREARRELLERSARSGPPPSATKHNGDLPSPPPKTVAEVQATLALRSENETLRNELATSKARCKRLLSLIAECDMKEKAQLIIEVEKLRQVRDELTTHVTALTGELEQQKSRAQEMAKELRNNGQGKKNSSSAN